MRSQIRFLIINANPTMLPYRVAPLGAAFVASMALHLGAETRFVDTPFSTQDFFDLEKNCKQFQPDCLALSVRNLDNSDFHEWQTYLEHPAFITKKIREWLPGVPVIAGGAASTVDPELVIQTLGVDSVILGEGEAALGFLFEKIRNGEKIPEILSDHGQPFRVESLFDLPLPRLYHWVNMKDYMHGDCGYPIQTKRGCPLKCIYCTYARIEGRRYRLIPANKVVDEIEAASRMGISDFEFVDSTFNLPPHHAKAVLREILRRGLKLNFTGTGINPARLDDEMMMLMKQCGFKTILVTAESASAAMLSSYQKGFLVESLWECSRKIDEYGFLAMWVFLMGGPGETEETVDETLDFIKNYVKFPHVAYITSGIRIYKNAPIEKISLTPEFSLDRMERENIAFYYSRHTPPQWLETKLRNFRKKNLNLMLSCEGHSRWIDFAQKIFSFLGIKKPWWRFIPQFNRIFGIFSYLERGLK